VADFQPYPHNLAPQVADLVELSDRDWDRNFTGSALRRIKPARWRRNATAIGLGDGEINL
jgi:epoxyqueuosine reductase